MFYMINTKTPSKLKIVVINQSARSLLNFYMKVAVKERLMVNVQYRGFLTRLIKVFPLSKLVQLNKNQPAAQAAGPDPS